MIKKNYFKAICRLLLFPLAFPWYLGKYNRSYPNDTIRQAWGAFKWTLARELGIGPTYRDLELQVLSESQEREQRQQELRAEMDLATTAEFVEVD